KRLPSIRTVEGVRVVEVVRDTLSEPSRSVPVRAREPARTSTSADLPARIDRWQRALLDMTYMNPLLKLKKASSTIVHVPSSMLATLEDKVAARHTKLGRASCSERVEISVALV